MKVRYTIMSETIAKQWLTELVSTAQQLDHAAHMNLISKNVSVVGVPGFDNISFHDWFNQTAHEFEQGVIADITYRGLKLRAATDDRIMFVTHETITGVDGKQNAQGIECLIEKEDDGRWRLVQQRVLDDEETRQYLPELT